MSAAPGLASSGFEERQKFLMGLGVEEEGTLVENSFLGLAARALEHELGELLPAQSCRSVEDCLRLGGRADLDYIIFAPTSRPAARFGGVPVAPRFCSTPLVSRRTRHGVRMSSIHLRLRFSALPRFARKNKPRQGAASEQIITGACSCSIYYIDNRQLV
jgi:hypothetical protein